MLISSHYFIDYVVFQNMAKETVLISVSLVGVTIVYYTIIKFIFSVNMRMSMFVCMFVFLLFDHNSS